MLSSSTLLRRQGRKGHDGFAWASRSSWSACDIDRIPSRSSRVRLSSSLSLSTGSGAAKQRLDLISLWYDGDNDDKEQQRTETKAQQMGQSNHFLGRSTILLEAATCQFHVAMLGGFACWDYLEVS